MNTANRMPIRSFRGFIDSVAEEKKNLIFIIALASGIRLFLMIYFQSYIIQDDFEFGWETGRIAKAMASGEGFSSPFRESSGPTAWLAPGYPFFLSILFKIFGIYSTKAAIALIIFNCFISALTCIPLYYLTKLIFGANVGYVAAISFAVYPPSVWHAINTIWDTTVFAFLMIIVVYWLIYLSNRCDLKSAILYGVFLGFVGLVNPVALAFIPFAFIWLLLQYKAFKRNQKFHIYIIPIMCFVTLIPWLYRNYMVLGRPMLRSNLGYEIKLGNSQEAWQDFLIGVNEPPWVRYHPSQKRNEFERYKYLGETKYAEQAFDESLSFIKENFGKFLILTMKRIYIFWFSDLKAKNEWAGSLHTTISISNLKKLCHLLPLPFLAIGIFWAKKKKYLITPLLAVLFFLPMVYYITNVTERYRYPIEPFILIFACYGLVESFRFVKTKISQSIP